MESLLSICFILNRVEVVKELNHIIPLTMKHFKVTNSWLCTYFLYWNIVLCASH